MSRLSVSLEKNEVVENERESVALYGVADDAEAVVLAEEMAVDAQIELAGAQGFAVVKDTGYRHKSFELNNVTLDGMIPKAADAVAEDVSDTVDIEEDVLAAYDISILEDGEEYQPDEAHPVHVEIALEGIDPEQRIAIRHITDDGTIETIEAFTVEEGKVCLDAVGFSVYVIVNAPEPLPYGDTATKLTDLTSSRAASGFYLSVTEGDAYDHYFKSTLNKNNALEETTSIDEAAVWYFEPADESGSKYRIYTLDGEEKRNWAL